MLLIRTIKAENDVLVGSTCIQRVIHLTASETFNAAIQRITDALTLLTNIRGSLNTTEEKLF
jgi:hypothetical protein